MRVRLRNNSNGVAAQIRAASNRSAEAMGRLVAGEVRKTLSRGTRTGSTGIVPETSVPYTMSAPGEPPAVRTGQLANSYTFVLLGSNRVRVGSDAPQSQLEFGVENVAPRPHLRPTIERVTPALRRITQREFKR